MSLKSINSTLQEKRGFTIVELLIVIVVIGILAAITIVAYNGVTARANLAAVETAAGNFAKKAEIYQAEEGNYPIAAADLTGAAADKAFALTGVDATYDVTAVSEQPASGDNNNIRVLKCADGETAQADIDETNIGGLEIYFWDYTTGAETTTPVTVGDASTCPTS